VLVSIETLAVIHGFGPALLLLLLLNIQTTIKKAQKTNTLDCTPATLQRRAGQHTLRFGSLMNMFATRSRCLNALALGLSVLTLSACGDSSPTAAASAAQQARTASSRAPQSVTLYTVTLRDMPLEFHAPGSLLASQLVELRPQVASTVQRVLVREGQEVRAGQLLFVLDARGEQANLDKAQATLARERATQADLERQWLRAQELRAQNFIAQSAADALQAQREAQRALLMADEAAVRAAQTALSLMSLRAPLSGRTGLVSVNPGSLVQPGGPALVSIAQMDPISVSFALPEAQWSALLAQRGGAQQLKNLPLTVRLNPQASSPGLTGQLSFVDNSVDSASGTIHLKGQLPNPNGQLWPGQYVGVSLRAGVLKAVAVLPQAALILRGAERLVYVLDPAGQAQLRQLRLRHSSGEWVAVEGVQAGERVVLEGKQNLRPGTPVQELKAKPGRQAAQAASGGASGGAEGAGLGVGGLAASGALPGPETRMAARTEPGAAR
jgi:RND family efflux transporter MFP subunit